MAYNGQTNPFCVNWDKTGVIVGAIQMIRKKYPGHLSGIIR